uniref:hypothetical protein n=1 Tax=Clostridium sp. NkU-1 TaxID=1095009 RepID=UPI0006D0BA48
MLDIESVCDWLKVTLKAEKVEYVNDTRYPNASEFLRMFDAKFKSGEILEIKFNEIQKCFYFKKDNVWVRQEGLILEM